MSNLFHDDFLSLSGTVLILSGAQGDTAEIDLVSIGNDTGAISAITQTLTDLGIEIDTLSGFYDSLDLDTENNFNFLSASIVELDTNLNTLSATTITLETKLDGIETGATADQTGAEIKVAYEAEADTNAFTDAEQTKLGGIETGATADQTGAEIKVAYEAEVNTNGFTDSEKAKLAAIDATHYLSPLQSVTELSALTEANLTDKARVYVEDDLSDYFYDATAISGVVIPAGQTGGTGFWKPVLSGGETSTSIKAKYESNADTNAFTDAEQTKLGGIETGATADQTGAEIKVAYEAEANTNAFTDAHITALELAGWQLKTASFTAEPFGRYITYGDNITVTQNWATAGDTCEVYYASGNSVTLDDGVTAMNVNTPNTFIVTDFDGASTYTRKTFRDSSAYATIAGTDGLIRGSDVSMARVAGSTYHTAQHWRNNLNSTGLVAGDGITDDADGTITVAAGSVAIRATDDQYADLLFADFAAESGANVALVDNDLNYIYVEYNAGTPRVIATTTRRTDHQTNILLGTVYRNGTVLHITAGLRVDSSDTIRKLNERLQNTEPFKRASGGLVSEIGTRNIAITAGTWWEGLYEFTTTALDTSAAGTFISYHIDSTDSSGFLATTGQTQINNTQYDDGSNTLATLSNNQYGVHWIYLGQDGDVYHVFGRGTYTLSEAEKASPPSTVPPHFEGHATILGKIIIQKDAVVFTSVENSGAADFIPSVATDHNELIGLQGGTVDEYYHLTSSQLTNVLSVRKEGGGVVVTGTNDPTTGGADNTGTDTIISGYFNYSNTGQWCSISGYFNYSNSGDFCNIGGSQNHSNSGDMCNITGSNNHTNSGLRCLISGYDNTSNSGDYCSITGHQNYDNSGNYCFIAGRYNIGNFGIYCTLTGEGFLGTKRVTTGATGVGSTETIAKTAHGLVAGDPLRFTVLAGGTGLNTTTTYYVINPTTNDFQVSASKGGSNQFIGVDYTDVQYIAKAINYSDYVSINGSGNYSNVGSYTSIGGRNNYDNTGSYCSIVGDNNYNNSGSWTSIVGFDNRNNSCSWSSISGNYNHSNTGDYCQISGTVNRTNTGDYCLITGRNNSSNTGSHTSISGYNNYGNSGFHFSISGYENKNNSGNSSLISGRDNEGNALEYCTISGYQNANNSCSFSTISGWAASNNTLDYARVHGGGVKARIIDLVAKTATTDATATTLTLGGGAEGATNRINIPANTAWAFEIMVVAKKSGASGSKKMCRQGLIQNDAGTVTISTVGTIGTDISLGTITATIAITADDTNDALKIVGTGAAAQTTNWVARVELTQVND